jgi:hypothetical protein
MTTDSMTLRNQEMSRADDSPFLTFRLSWVAYLREVWAIAVRLVILALASLVIAQAVSALTKQPPPNWIFGAGFVVALLWTAYSVALKRSVRLYTDDTGVWVYSGVFPWETGVTGVKWQDISESTYTLGFMSWMLRSFSVRVGHRFTNGAELYVENIHRGNVAVEHINGVLASIAGRVSRRN